MQDEAYFAQSCAKVAASREKLTAGMQDLGFEVLPSTANFVFARHPRHDAAQLAASLRAQAILVRHFAKTRIEQFLRITVGTDAECDRLLTALHNLLR